ncbi:MAG: hypothetical protein M1820_000363 [Bogoriella megaspora]|nr:MAG: hypothetical protein M1820_000363 [Bogoriella megaspora]
MSNITNTVGDAVKSTGNYVSDTASSAYNTVTGNTEQNNKTKNPGVHQDAKQLGKDVESMKDNALKDVDKQWNQNVDKAKDQLDKTKS